MTRQTHGISFLMQGLDKMASQSPFQPSDIQLVPGMQDQAGIWPQLVHSWHWPDQVCRITPMDQPHTPTPCRILGARRSGITALGLYRMKTAPLSLTCKMSQMKKVPCSNITEITSAKPYLLRRNCLLSCSGGLPWKPAHKLCISPLFPVLPTWTFGRQDPTALPAKQRTDRTAPHAALALSGHVASLFPRHF